MNPIVKAKWLKALRSGDYEQGRGVLRTADDKFCCLGVLCDLYGRVNGEEWQGGTWEDDDSGDWEIAGGTALLSSDVQEWAGLESEDPLVNGRTLSDWNDAHGRDFNAIADMIQAEL
jgi:hypothetical protein